MSVSPQDLQDLKARFQAELDAYFAAKKADIVTTATASATAAVNAAISGAGLAPLTSQQALALIDAIKAKGVKHFAGSGLDFEFFAVGP